MTDSGEVVRVHVDFNDMDPEGQFFVMPEDASAELVPHAEVNLYDAEGNTALGSVVELLGERGAMLAMVAGSWRPRLEGSVEQQVCTLVAHTAKASPPREAWYRLSTAPTGMIVQAVALASSLPRSEGAVLSSV